MPVQDLDFRDLQDDITEGDRVSELFMRVSGMSPEEMRLSEEISERLVSRAWDMAHGKPASYDDIFDIMNDVAEEHGFEHGMPIPTFDTERGIGDVITARRSPLHGLLQTRFWRSAMEEQLAAEHIPVRNSWDRLGDQTVCIVPTSEGPQALPRPHYGQRLRLWMDTVVARMHSALTVEAEMRALESLKSKVNPSQWKCYVLNGCFPEKSERSGLHYFFRKGYPTLVISYNKSPEGAVICALCLHPFGYHRGTFAGVMTPTDEVIAALTLLRGDEPGLWKKAGQWRIWDVRSGI